jgi:hypothetical protein
LSRAAPRHDHPPVDEALVAREEVTQMLLAILDMSQNVFTITEILEEEFGGEGPEEET